MIWSYDYTEDCTMHFNMIRFTIAFTMTKENLETKAQKAILKIEESVTRIEYAVGDLSMKLCHLIRDRRSYQDMLEGEGPYYESK